MGVRGSHRSGPSPSHPRRELIGAILDAPVVRRVSRRLPRWRGALGLNYHRIGRADGTPWDHGLWSATQEGLDGHLAALRRDADIVAPGDLTDLARSRRPGRHVFLTFDDGYRDNYEQAYPVLRAHGAPAGFFLATGFLDHPRAAWWDEIAWMVRRATRPWMQLEAGNAPKLALAGAEQRQTITALLERYKGLDAQAAEALLERIAEATGSGRCPQEQAAKLWMNWEMAREMRDGGMQIGGHTVDHPLLSRVSPERQTREIDGCRARIQAELGASMSLFAYPVGSRDSFTSTTQALLEERGVALAFSFYGGLVRFDRFQAYDVPRIHVDPTMSGAALKALALAPAALVR